MGIAGGKAKQGCLPFLLSLFNFGKKAEIEYPYVLRGSILTPAERNFYDGLRVVMGDKYIILMKVKLSDIFLIYNTMNFRSALNRLNSKHVDFLLCSPKEKNGRI